MRLLSPSPTEIEVLEGNSAKRRRTNVAQWCSTRFLETVQKSQSFAKILYELKERQTPVDILVPKASTLNASNRHLIELLGKSLTLSPHCDGSSSSRLTQHEEKAIRIRGFAVSHTSSRPAEVRLMS
ncbi:unnamed protein product [Cyprideis torosa]|uniref:Uncharacterized protein n=1 Tax=Cyprideis torosa TaxID=163714 RepID=A0A7R8W965_9CRUS|nr:unnamed protein product [Cyprideis torosa]CAG0884057.1 unnamed protein product [Cyprideis torosa]